MLFDFSDLPADRRAKLLLSTVVPRPIAWVTSTDPDGLVNAAPFSFFNLMAADPPVVALGVAPRGGASKDTAANIRSRGEFVVNLVTAGLATAMNITAFDFGRGEAELEVAGLETAPSARVAPPRIAASPVALECATMAIHDLPTGNMIILAEVLALQIDSAMLLDVERCYVDTPALDLIGRMHGGGWYSHTRDRFEMPRLKPDQLPTTRRQDNKAGGED